MTGWEFDSTHFEGKKAIARVELLKNDMPNYEIRKRYVVGRFLSRWYVEVRKVRHG